MARFAARTPSRSFAVMVWRGSPGALSVLVAPVVFDQAGRRQAVAVGGVNGHKRIRQPLPPHPLRLLGVVLDHGRRDHHLMAARSAACDRVHRLGDLGPRGVLVVVHGQRGKEGRGHTIPMFGRDGLERVRRVLPPEVPGVVYHHQERLRGLDCELVHPSDHSPHCVGAEWPLCGKPVFLPDGLPRVEDGRTGQAPVYDLRRAPPRLFLPLQHLPAARRCVCRLRPHNGRAVTPCHQEKPFPGRWRPVVRRHQFPPFHGIPQGLQLRKPFAEGLSGLGFHRVAFPYRPPGLELLHVLQDDHPGPHGPGPPQNDPGQAPYVLVHRLSALCL